MSDTIITMKWEWLWWWEFSTSLEWLSSNVEGGWRKNFNFVSTTKSNFSHFRSRQNLMNERDFSMYTDSNNFSWFCTIKHETMMKCARSNFLVREIVVESAGRNLQSKRKNQMKLKNEFILAHNYTQFLWKWMDAKRRHLKRD